MAPFVPPEPPLVPDAPEPPPTLDTPLAPPEVGFGSPWAPADAENRDRILDWWRMWFRRVFFPWITAWVAYWAAQWARIIAYLNEWLAYAGEYIEQHAVNGHSWYKTDTPINPLAPTVVVIAPYDEFRPLLIGDLVSDTTFEVNYGRITALVDNTHAEVTWIGTLLGHPGYGWRTTETAIAHAGTTNVVLAADIREPQVGDLIIDDSASAAYGIVTVVIDPTHATVQFIGTLQGPLGYGWRTTETDIAHAGTTDVVLAVDPQEPQVGDLVVDDSTSAAYGIVTVVTDPTHVTVQFIGTLQGPAGGGTDDAFVAALVADPGSDTHAAIIDLIDTAMEIVPIFYTAATLADARPTTAVGQAVYWTVFSSDTNAVPVNAEIGDKVDVVEVV